MIPIHPQPVPDQPDLLRWIIPAGLLPRSGPVAAVPGPLAGLLSDGTLTGITVEPAAVVTRLGTGRSWSRDGARVRTALHTALDEPGAWQPATDTAASHDDVLLRAAAEDLLVGRVGDLARSHGGEIGLVDVHDGIVTVRLTGACHGCPAAWMTLQWRLEAQLRRRHPGLREVRSTGSR